MKEIIVRIQGVEIENFRNVKSGSIRLPCNLKKNVFEKGSDILGIYGQNGSGKTAFIHVLSIFKLLLSGESLPVNVLEHLSVSGDFFSFTVQLSIEGLNVPLIALYSVVIAKREIRKISKLRAKVPVVSHELLQVKEFKDGKWSKYRTIIDFDYGRNDVFLPKDSLKSMFGGSEDTLDELRALKMFSSHYRTSFIFNDEVTSLIDEKDKNIYYRNIIFALNSFALRDFFVITDEDLGLAAANIILPLSFRQEDDIGTIGISLEKTATYPEKALKVIENVIASVNCVVSSIIPGLSIELAVIGRQLSQSAEVEDAEFLAELVSIRDGKRIPMRNESNGIKKIVSILHLLIYMYNNPSMTLAVDELDSGVFEYLLGELLSIIKERGKGQLIFTSHNLRPLEKLNKNSIVFTTTNPSDRYIRLKNVKPNNNLRDVYFLDIILGSRSETLYHSMDNAEIAVNMRLAGEKNGLV